MSKYLTKVIETYRVDTEAEATRLIEEAKKSNYYTLIKYDSTLKEIKEKKEVVETYYRVTLTKLIDDEKYPIADVQLSYDREGDFGSED